MVFQASHLSDDEMAELARGTRVDANLEGHLGQCMTCKARLGASLLVKGLLAAPAAAEVGAHLSAASMDSLHSALFEGVEVPGHELLRQCAHINQCDACFTRFFNLHLELTPGTAAVERAERATAKAKRHEPVGALTISIALGAARLHFSRALSLAPKALTDVLIGAMSMRDARKTSKTPWRKVRPSGHVSAFNHLSPMAVKASASPPQSSDLAMAHEYLLARSASRSDEPVVLGGKRLPTEGELLRMADSEYMNERQLAFFKYRLQQMEQELLQNADETTEHLRELDKVPELADRATIEEERALELRTRDRERKLLKKVQQALARVDSGRYGYCEETGDPIGIPRLLARPTATLSREAQQRRELKEQMHRDVALHESGVPPERAPSELEEFEIERAALRLGVRVVWDSGNASLEVRVTDRASGSPRSGAFLSVVGPRQRRLASAVTGVDGTATLPLSSDSKLLRVRTTRTGKAWDINLALSD